MQFAWSRSLRRLGGTLLVVLTSFGVAVAVGEALLRSLWTFQPEPNYLDTIRNTVLTRPRLWVPGVDVTYDIRGLYLGAVSSRLRTNHQRLIEPVPVSARTPRVLFMGGSTTEALYVPERERWVALLDAAGSFAAYNAGQSGGNTVDAYYGYRYLTETKKLDFNLVVLMTPLNDLHWFM